MTKIFTKYEPIPNTRVNDKNYHKNPPKPKSPDPRPQATFLITHPGGGGGVTGKNGLLLLCNIKRKNEPSQSAFFVAII